MNHHFPLNGVVCANLPGDISGLERDLENKSEKAMYKKACLQIEGYGEGPRSNGEHYQEPLSLPNNNPQPS
jgi:hypothetical protein